MEQPLVSVYVCVRGNDVMKILQLETVLRNKNDGDSI